MSERVEDLLAHEACRIVAQSGTQGLSRVTLANHLAIPPAEACERLPSDERLLVLVTNTLFDRVEIPTGPDLHWRLTMKDLLVQVCEIFHHHPGTADFHARHPVETRPGTLSDAFDDIMNRAGFLQPSIESVKLALYYSMLGRLLDRPWNRNGSHRLRSLDHQFMATLDFALTAAQTQLGADVTRPSRSSVNRNPRGRARRVSGA